MRGIAVFFTLVLVAAVLAAVSIGTYYVEKIMFLSLLVNPIRVLRTTLARLGPKPRRFTDYLRRLHLTLKVPIDPQPPMLTAKPHPRLHFLTMVMSSIPRVLPHLMLERQVRHSRLQLAHRCPQPPRNRPLLAHNLPLM